MLLTECEKGCQDALGSLLALYRTKNWDFHSLICVVLVQIR